jgi:hypothetical protein
LFRDAPDVPQAYGAQSFCRKNDPIRKELAMNRNRIRRLIGAATIVIAGLTSVGAMATPAHALNPQPIPPGHTH